ncbi:MAG: LacI family DNA-binding transcriptional regulator [Ancrocorticia sp.]|jgi:DNA-binding LacI/PurR family transcriptional regulator|nr:LacI family DNA-binding transcriptional regulator [Ancrocorticia sp.]MCI2002491.1 LacI family DNA-binding transcriptional regulator [Ancrocorticia sp.]
MPSSRRSANGHAPSMADVAKIAGVSHQTVSRVLNHQELVRPDTRAKVLKAIEETGYRRNETARALATNRSKVLGIITPSFSHYGPATTLLSVQLAAHDVGYIVTVATLSTFESESLRSALDQFLGQGVAGIVVIAPVAGIARELEEATLSVPTIVIASSWISPQSSLLRVGIEQRSGVHAVIAHLALHGCRTIAHIAGPPDWFDAAERKSAWEDSLREFGLDRGPLFSGDWTARSGYRIAQELLSKPLPDAVFVANDQMALGVLHALNERGIRIPEDIRIVGYDDEETSAYLTPSLTTVRQDFHALGTEAVHALIDVIHGDAAAVPTVHSELRIRNSG